MANNEELEVKILKVNVDEVKNKLKELNAISKGNVIQKIYTYDCYPPILMYKLALNDYKITNSKYSLLKIANMYSYIEPIISEAQKKIIKNITGYVSVKEYIEKQIDNVKLELLEDTRILKIIEESDKCFFKWIRLRENGSKIELTVKYIYSANDEYEIDKVKEYEINVSNLEMANMIVEQMGYIKKKYVEKRRESYILNGVRIEIDTWPLIKPYIEIEGDSVEEVYKTVEKLGFKKENTKVMNTEEVYLLEGYDLNSYTELKL